MTCTALPRIMRTIDDVATYFDANEEFVRESKKYWYYKDVIFNERQPEMAKDEYPLMSRFRSLKEFVGWYAKIMYQKLKEAAKLGTIDKGSRDKIKRLFSLYSLAAPEDVAIFPIVEKKVDGYKMVGGDGVQHATFIRPEAILPDGSRIEIPLTYIEND